MAAVDNVVIVGGGIGGLTLAVALRQAGIAARIIEKGDRSTRLGTGISLLGNALRALETIGLADTCIEAGLGYDRVITRDATGAFVNDMRPPRTFRPDRPGAFGIMRPKLAETLETAAVAAGATIDFATTVGELTQHEDRIDLVLSTGEQLSADLVVAADGAYSATRARIFGDAYVPAYCGQGGIRLTADRPADMDGLTFYRAADGAAVGAIPLSDTHCYYFVLENGTRHGHLDPARIAEIWKERMAPFTAPNLVASAATVGAHSPISYRPFDVLMVPRPWHKGRVVLIGDAAHSLSPQLTSGGGMAIEDAVVLAETLRDGHDAATALHIFENRREPRVRSILETSLAICKIEQNPTREGHQKSMELLGKGYQLLADAF